ncbi:CinA family protein [Bradyrhizobium prioriisuperbiae]|uniref:CinA family protein n=1 Tax=Bradyrhizobium prioriisuperbiae TaxID=2854389 RepID=UPI0028E623B2|nr:CinA family protein [Bradyrhizobium prioritasuperba]
MQTLIPLAETIAARLIERGETVGVGESSTGGLISAALLAVSGASAYFRGGGVIYTPRARAALVNITKEEMEGIRAASEPYALLLARKTRDLLGSTWGLSETGATGPTGNRYGDAAGHSCTAVVGGPEGQLGERVMTIETGSADRQANMRTFALRALEQFADVIGAPR